MDSREHIAWFAVVTRWGQWKKISERLGALKVKHFIPPPHNTLVFLRTEKSRALNLVNAGEIKGRFLVDHGTHSLLEIPDNQMDAFIRVVTECPEAVLTPETPIRKGARVRVVRGSLKGVEGEVVENPNGVSLVVRILSILSAKVSIPREDLALL